MHIALCGCDPAYSRRFDRAFQTQLILDGADSECGPIDIGALVPDCPVDGACFTPACTGHNHCYGTCGADKRACDDQFFHDMVSICSESFPLIDPQYTSCRYFALTYWLAVAQAGQAAFDQTQRDVCPLPPDPAPGSLGACCQAGAPATCTDAIPFIDCPAQAVFIPDFTCRDVDELLGGCPVPVHDDCAQKLPICAGAAPDVDLGRCAGDTDAQRGGGVCRVSSQDCANGLTCLPVEGDAFRCVVETDNRLASTDGPQVGEDCFNASTDSFQADLWYAYVAPCSGTLTIRMCAAITYDATLAVYGTYEKDGTCACPTDNTNLLACNDDFCGVGTVSGVTVEKAVAGACYTLRVGGWADAELAPDPQRGVSELDIGMLCDPR